MPNGGSEAGISFEDVSQYFMLQNGANTRVVEALAGVSLKIPPRQFVALVGASGCGKTTLLNIAAGLGSPQVGTVMVNGSKPAVGRHDVAYMLARDALLPWRAARRNVEYGLELRGVDSAERSRRAEQLLAAVGLSDFAGAYRSQLSHGMRQRVALARTFALPSPILLMDEPFGALDVHLKLQLGELLLRLWEADKRTVVFVTHDLQEAIALADRLIVMQPKPGRIVGDIEVPFSRPRSLQALQLDPGFHELYRQVWSLMSHA